MTHNYARLHHDYRLHPDAFEWMPDQVRYGPLQDWLRYIKSDPLRRIRSGSFTLERAVTVDTLKTAPREELFRAMLSLEELADILIASCLLYTSVKPGCCMARCPEEPSRPS